MRIPVGRWRIVEMEMWDQGAIELLGPGFIEFTGDGTSRFAFIAVTVGWTADGLSVTANRSSSSAGLGMMKATR